MADSRLGETTLSDLRVDEEMWGPGAEPIVKEWLAANYDPATMPTLQVAEIKGREGLWLLGWDAEGTEFQGLLIEIFGEGYAVARLDQVNAMTKAMLGDDIPDGSFGQGLM